MATVIYGGLEYETSGTPENTREVIAKRLAEQVDPWLYVTDESKETVTLYLGQGIPVVVKD